MKWPKCIYPDRNDPTKMARAVQELHDQLAKMFDGGVDGRNLSRSTFGSEFAFDDQTGSTPGVVRIPLLDPENSAYIKAKGSDTAETGEQGGIEFVVQATDSNYGKICVVDSDDTSKQIMSLVPDSVAGVSDPGGEIQTQYGELRLEPKDTFPVKTSQQFWFGANTAYFTKFTAANSADRTATFPDKDGTVSYTSDLGDYVKKDGSTPLTGDWNAGAFKILLAAIQARTAAALALKDAAGDTVFNISSGGTVSVRDAADPTKIVALDASAVATGTTRTFAFQNSSGTLALLSDIPSVSGYVKTDGSVPMVADWDAGAYTFKYAGLQGRTAAAFTLKEAGGNTVASIANGGTTTLSRTWAVGSTAVFTHRQGAVADLPSLATGEVWVANDVGRAFIGVSA